jgi:apolipoprotein N-acyltransferase
MKPALRLAPALLTGLALPFISAPMNLHWLHWVAFLPLFWYLRGLDLRRGILLAYATGWFGNLLIFWWLIETMQRFSSLPWLAAFAIHLLTTTIFSLSYGLMGLMPWLRTRLGSWWMLALPVVVVAGEQAFPVLFPYYQGVSQYRVPAMFQLASVTGVMGVSFLVMLVNSVLAEAVFAATERRALPIKAAALTALLIVANLGFGTWRHAKLDAALNDAPELQVAILQQGVTMEQRMLESPWEGFFEWSRLTAKIADQHPDLVIWPEGAIAFNPNEPRTFDLLSERSLKILTRRLARDRVLPLLEFPDDVGVLSANNPKLLEAMKDIPIGRVFQDFSHKGAYDLLIGGGTILDNPAAGPEHPEEPDYIAHNSLYVFDKSGEIEGRYDKMVPLPFGEYIPFSDTFPFLKHIIEGPGDFQAGTAPVFFEVDTKKGQTVRYTTPICYEAILQSTMRLLAGGDTPQTTADFFVNITNDGWFGDTASPHQHAMLTAVQTIQLGRPMLRIAYTGVSWVVEPSGDILYETAPFTEVAKVVPMRIRSFTTIYSRGGWIFGWLCVAGAVGFVVWGRSRQGKTTSTNAAA